MSILTWPGNRCTCSIGIPLSIAIVADDRLNLCRWTLAMFTSRPIFLNHTSTPLTVSLPCGDWSETKRAGLLSLRLSVYFLRWILVRALKYTSRSLFTLPNTTHCRFWKSMPATDLKPTRSWYRLSRIQRRLYSEPSTTVTSHYIHNLLNSNTTTWFQSIPTYSILVVSASLYCLVPENHTYTSEPIAKKYLTRLSHFSICWRLYYSIAIIFYSET